MNELIEEPDRLTGALSEQERSRLLEYYGEMIDDRVEEGLDEAEAVAAMYDAAALARELVGLGPAKKPGEPRIAVQTVSGDVEARAIR